MNALALSQHAQRAGMPESSTAPAGAASGVNMLPDDVDWNAVWELFLAERESMNAVLRAALAAGVAHEDAGDLLHSFVLEKLPSIARRTASMSLSERGRYLRASLRNYLRSAMRHQRRHDAALRHLAEEMDIEASTHEVDLAPTPRSRGTAHDTVLQMFFGHGAPPPSIGEIARAAGMTRYMTRQTIVDGMVEVAIDLGKTGSLTPTDVEACIQILLRGRSVEQAASILGIAPSRVRGALQRAREFAGAALAPE